MHPVYGAGILSIIDACATPHLTADVELYSMEAGGRQTVFQCVIGTRKFLMTKSPPLDQESQLERFKEAARRLGCDEDGAAFDEKLKVIARQKPRSLAPVDKSDDAVGKGEQNDAS